MRRIHRAVTFARVNGPVLCSAIKVYKIDIQFTQTLVRDQRHGLLIAFPNENIL